MDVWKAHPQRRAAAHTPPTPSLSREASTARIRPGGNHRFLARTRARARGEVWATHQSEVFDGLERAAGRPVPLGRR
jgi:hypothetical protein